MTTTTRRAQIERITKETSVQLELALDGSGTAECETGVPFLDHMLTLFAVHGLFDLRVRAGGDLEVDGHHTVEDVGIVLGQALRKALADKKGIRRYGEAAVPMDEALARVTLDCSSRPYLVLRLPPLAERVGSFETELLPEFLRAFAQQGGLTLHVEAPYGTNSHHVIEAVFKALGRALAQAVALDERRTGVPSSKGLL